MDISKGIVEIDNELVVKPNFTFEQFKETKYYTNQDGIRIIYLDGPQIIKNRKYIELPTELNSKITMIEIFDTANFIDFIDSEVNLEFGNIYNNQIEMKLNINDELIKLEYKGLLNIK